MWVLAASSSAAFIGLAGKGFEKPQFLPNNDHAGMNCCPEIGYELSNKLIEFIHVEGREPVLVLIGYVSLFCGPVQPRCCCPCLPRQLALC